LEREEEEDAVNIEAEEAAAGAAPLEDLEIASAVDDEEEQQAPATGVGGSEKRANSATAFLSFAANDSGCFAVAAVASGGLDAADTRAAVRLSLNSTTALSGSEKPQQLDAATIGSMNLRQLGRLKVADAAAPGNSNSRAGPVSERSMTTLVSRKDTSEGGVDVPAAFAGDSDSSVSARYALPRW
jgi:hypothetical protein